MFLTSYSDSMQPKNGYMEKGKFVNFIPLPFYLDDITNSTKE